jgi:hypothetical protein
MLGFPSEKINQTIRKEIAGAKTTAWGVCGEARVRHGRSNGLPKILRSDAT